MTPTVGLAAPPVPQMRRLRYEPDTEAATVQLALVVTPPPPPPPRAPRELPVQRTIEDEVVRRCAQQALRLTLEVLDGRRPPAHLAELVEPSVGRYVAAAAAHRPAVAHAPAARLRSMRLDQPRPGAAEIAAVCQLCGRIRAVAARFELHDGGWRCTAFRLG